MVMDDELVAEAGQCEGRSHGLDRMSALNQPIEVVMCGERRRMQC